MSILSLQQLSKSYGSIKALKNVSFEVPAGSVFGILGPNGSGKTTLLGVVMDVLKASAGSYRFFDQDPTPDSRKKMGTLLETPNFYHYLSALDNLRIAAAIKGKGEDDIENVLQLVNLSERKKSKFNSFSLGMKQRLAIASCLLGDPEVLVFDEPTNGLDPVGIAEIRELIKKLSSQGKTIIMASHLLDEVEKVCTHVAILLKGQLITVGPVNDILIQEDIVEAGASNLDGLLNIFSQLEDCKKMVKQSHWIDLHFSPGKASLENINQLCFENGLVLNHLRLRKKSLEAKFLELTQTN